MLNLPTFISKAKIWGLRRLWRGSQTRQNWFKSQPCWRHPVRLIENSNRKIAQMLLEIIQLAINLQIISILVRQVLNKMRVILVLSNKGQLTSMRVAQLPYLSSMSDQTITHVSKEMLTWWTLLRLSKEPQHIEKIPTQREVWLHLVWKLVDKRTLMGLALQMTVRPVLKDKEEKDE